MTIRPAAFEDIPGFIALQSTVEKEGSIWGYLADSHPAWMARDLSWSLTGTNDEGMMSGFLYARPRAHAGEVVFPKGSRILEIVELIVNPEHQKCGEGTLMLKKVQQLAQTAGFMHLRLYTAAKRFDGVVRFYKACGFAPWYCEMTAALTPDAPKGAVE